MSHSGSPQSIDLPPNSLQPRTQRPATSPLLPLPPGAMPPVIVARSQSTTFSASSSTTTTITLSAPSPSKTTTTHAEGRNAAAGGGGGGGLMTLTRRLSRSMKRERAPSSSSSGEVASEEKAGGMASSRSMSSVTALSVMDDKSGTGPAVPQPSSSGSSKLAPLLHRFPSLRRTPSRSSSTHSLSPSPTPSPPSPSPHTRRHPSPSSSTPPSAYHTPLTGPAPSPAGSVVPLPLSSSPPGRRSLSSPRQSYELSIPVPPPPQRAEPKRAMTVPVLPTTTPSARPSQPPAHAKPFHALLELLTTERHYLHSLALLVDVYLPALTPLVHPATYTSVARNLPQLRAHHASFLRRLEEVVDLPRMGFGRAFVDGEEGGYPDRRVLQRVVACVAALFVDCEETWRLYEPYCAHHSQALDVLERVASKLGAGEWRAWERKCVALSLSSPSSPAWDGAGSRASSPGHGHEEDRERGGAVAGGRPLRLADQLVKPVQQICRYPLLLEKLLPLGGEEGEGEVGIEEAWELMRVVARRVNEARDLRSREVRGERILARLEGPGAGQGFALAWDALGTPVLVGGLDVLILPLPSSSSPTHVSPHSSIPPGAPLLPSAGSTSTSSSSSVSGSQLAQTQPTLKVRYLGAFLYPGHMVLVKPRKGGAYEVRQCLDLRACMLVDLPAEDETAPLQNGFCLAMEEARFWFGAACAQERAVWVPAVAHVLAQLGQDEEGTSTETATTTKPTATATPTPPQPAVQSILRRPSASQRHTADRLLADVFSESCITARAGCVLFPDPTPPPAASSSSTSFSRIMRRSESSPTPTPNDAASTPVKRKRLSVRSLSSIPVSLVVDESGLTSVPEGESGEPGQEREGEREQGGSVPPANRRRRTYSQTMNSVRGAFLPSKRPASLQNILNLYGTTASSAMAMGMTDAVGAPPSLPPTTTTTMTVRPAPAPPTKSTFSFMGLPRAGSIRMSARLRTRSAPDTASLASTSSPPTSPTSTLGRTKTRPPPVDTTLGARNGSSNGGGVSTGSATASGSDPNSPIEFRATGKYSAYVLASAAAAAASPTESVSASGCPSADGHSQEGAYGEEENEEDEEDTSPEASEESAVPPTTAHAVHVRSPSDDTSERSTTESTVHGGLPTEKGVMDLSRLMPEDARRLNLSTTSTTTAPTPAPALARNGSLRRPATGFFGRLNPFTPVG